MTNIAEVCLQFPSFLLALEVGPWKDDGSGEVVSKLLEDGSDGIRFNTPTTVDVNDAPRVAQLTANEKGCKVALSISGTHKEDGMSRMKLGVFYPQIVTAFRTPQSIYLEVKAPNSGRISAEGDNLADAKEFLTNTILRSAMTFYVWPGGRKTRRPIPEAPEGHELMIIMVEPSSRNASWQDTEEFFVAFQIGKRPRFKNDNAGYGEFVILKDGNAYDVKLPEGSYVHNGDCWTVANLQCWWQDGR